MAPAPEAIRAVTELRWAVAAAYFIAATLSFLASRRSPDRECSFWLGAAVALVLMGIAKQFQLQDDIAGAARDLLKTAGWYDWHEEAQWLLGALIATALLGSLALLGSWLRGGGRTVKAAAASLSLLIAFVLVRAASLHAMDEWVVREVLGMRLGWWVELAGIAAIAASTLAFLNTRRRSL
jgi:hypothetical protein